MLKKLVLTHGLSPIKLRHALRMGGLIAPSLAISRIDAPAIEYGEISLVADLSCADPASDKSAHLFSADIYSARYPAIFLKFKARDFAVIRRELKATCDRFDFDELKQGDVERRGVEAICEHPAVRALFLASRGIDLVPQIVEVPTLPAWLEPHKDDSRMTHELVADADFVSKCIADFEATARERWRGKPLNEELLRHLVSSARSLLSAHRHSMERAGRIDSAANCRLVQSHFSKIGDYDGLTEFANQLLSLAPYQERLFSHSDSDGNNYFVDHSVANVLKIMKRSLQGGENFSFGVGALRAHYAPRIRSLAEIDTFQYLLQSKAEFEATKETLDTMFFSLRESLSPFHERGDELGFHDRVAGLIEDMRTMTYARAAEASSFAKEIPDEAHQQIHAFCEQLRSAGTEYFECKLLRQMRLSEFHGAAIPDTLSSDLRDALDRSGLKCIEYSRHNNEAKADAIRSLHAGLESVPTTRRIQNIGKSTVLCR